MYASVAQQCVVVGGAWKNHAHCKMQIFNTDFKCTLQQHSSVWWWVVVCRYHAHWKMQIFDLKFHFLMPHQCWHHRSSAHWMIVQNPFSTPLYWYVHYFPITYLSQLVVVQYATVKCLRISKTIRLDQRVVVISAQCIRCPLNSTRATANVFAYLAHGF